MLSQQDRNWFTTSEKALQPISFSLPFSLISRQSSNTSHIFPVETAPLNQRQREKPQGRSVIEIVVTKAKE